METLLCVGPFGALVPPLRTAHDPQKGFWSIYHIGIIIGSDIWPCLCFKVDSLFEVCVCDLLGHNDGLLGWFHRATVSSADSNALSRDRVYELKTFVFRKG